MSKLLARILFFIPMLIMALGLLSALGHEVALPKPAQDYLSWYLNQPLDVWHWLVNRIAAAGILGLVLSTFGLMFFWPPARYFYVVSTVFMMLGNISDVPILETSYQLIIDDMLGIFVGLNIGLIFSVSMVRFFAPQRDNGEQQST